MSSSECIWSGQVFKFTDSVFGSSWKPRWLVLSTDALSVHSKQKSTTPDRLFPLSELSVRGDPDASNGMFTFTISIASGTDSVTFGAETFAIMDEWVRKIQSAMSKKSPASAKKDSLWPPPPPPSPDGSPAVAMWPPVAPPRKSSALWQKSAEPENLHKVIAKGQQQKQLRVSDLKQPAIASASTVAEVSKMTTPSGSPLTKGQKARAGPPGRRPPSRNKSTTLEELKKAEEAAQQESLQKLPEAIFTATPSPSREEPKPAATVPSRPPMMMGIGPIDLNQVKLKKAS